MDITALGHSGPIGELGLRGAIELWAWFSSIQRPCQAS